MPTRSARIKLGLTDGRVEIDGQRLTGVTGISLDATVDSTPRLTVDLNLHQVDIEGDMAVTVPEKTRAALVALGWTPPAEAA